MSWNKVFLVTDGECKGNPGDIVVHCYYEIHNGKDTTTNMKSVGIANGTNNESEYLAVLYGLTSVLDDMINLELAPTNFDLIGVSDSQVVVKQLLGEFDVNSDNLLPYYEMVMNLLTMFNCTTYKWCSRDIVNIYLGLE